MSELETKTASTEKKGRGGCCLFYAWGWIVLLICNVVAYVIGWLYLNSTLNACYAAGGIVSNGSSSYGSRYYTPGVFVPLDHSGCQGVVNSASWLTHLSINGWVTAAFLMLAFSGMVVWNMTNSSSKKNTPEKKQD